MSQIDQNKILLGKILGEIYRIQNRMNIRHGLGPAEIYGLLNGFEDEIEGILQGMGYVSSQQVKTVINVLDSIRSDPKKWDEFKGFYDLEEELEELGVHREELISILTYFNAQGCFPEFFEKMKGADSPAQCKTFDLDEFNS